MSFSNGPFSLLAVFEYDLVTDLSAYLHHVVTLEYNERPDYQHCRGLFTKALKSVGGKPTDKLDFGPAPTAKSTPTVRLIYIRCILNTVLLLLIYFIFLCLL